MKTTNFHFQAFTTVSLSWFTTSSGNLNGSPRESSGCHESLVKKQGREEARSLHRGGGLGPRGVRRHTGRRLPLSEVQPGPRSATDEFGKIVRVRSLRGGEGVQVTGVVRESERTGGDASQKGPAATATSPLPFSGEFKSSTQYRRRIESNPSSPTTHRCLWVEGRHDFPWGLAPTEPNVSARHL